MDRSTLRGATPNPEESIESQWYTRAASTAFTLCIAIVGIGAAVFALMDWTLDPSLLLIGVFTVMVLCFTVSYLMIRRQES